MNGIYICFSTHSLDIFVFCFFFFFKLWISKIAYMHLNLIKDTLKRKCGWYNAMTNCLCKQNKIYKLFKRLYILRIIYVNKYI